MAQLRLWGKKKKGVPKPGIEPKPQQPPEPQQGQCWLLNPLSDQGTLSISFSSIFFSFFLFLFCLFAFSRAAPHSIWRFPVSLLTETAHKVLEVVPRGRQVLIRHHSPGVQPSISSSLWGGGATEITKKGVGTYGPASNTIGVTPASRLVGLCSEGICSGEGVKVSLSHLPEPVSQLLVNFILLDGGPSGPWVKVSCWASSGSPPITYSLVGRDSGTYMKQTQNYKEAANFSFPLTQTSCWLRCQAANNISAQHSALTLVPPGEQTPRIPEGQLALLGKSVGGAKSREGNVRSVTPPGQRKGRMAHV
uniref:IL-40-like Ig domain-containing protein n=1 Tax=Sus scrofa TaxID=9823 RepID=A0A8D0ZX90_PIG